MIATRAGRRAGRAAFTVLELLVVIFIIVILVTLSVAATVRLLGTSYTATTRTTIQRASSALQQRLSDALDKARKEAIPSGGTAMTLSTDAGGNPNADRARVIHMKLRMQQYFPTTFSEALWPANGNAGANYQAVQGYITYLAKFNITQKTVPAGTRAQQYLTRDMSPQLGPGPWVYNFESAVCLYMILRYGSNASGEDEIGLSGATKNVNGLPMIADAWGNPLVFCRWPIGDPKQNFSSPVNPNGAVVSSSQSSGSPPFVDPLDPKGLLSANNWVGTANWKTFQTLCHLLPSAPNTSVNLTPVIFSAGADGNVGLSTDPNDPNFPFPGQPLTVLCPGAVSNPNYSADNIYSTYTR
jgi:hypothetical protein